MHRLGLKVAMVTGDNSRTADAIARRLGIDEVVAEVLPDGKVDAVRRLKAEHGRLAFVGDGINDAPALAEADVGLAIGNIRQNLCWTFAYNAALIPVAAGMLFPVNGFLLSPVFAAGAMALSSVFVLGNALRLKGFRPPIPPQASAAPAGAPRLAPPSDPTGSRAGDMVPARLSSLQYRPTRPRPVRC